MPKITVIEPRAEGNGFVWDDLALKPTGQGGGGSGVFATRDLPVGTTIPIVAVEVEDWDEAKHGASHGWVRYVVKLKEDDRPKLDGHPSVHPFRGVGSFGLAIAMMLNEPSRGKPNCVFRLNAVVVQTRVPANTELTVFYGDMYEQIRQAAGYSLDGNPDRHSTVPHVLELKSGAPNRIYQKWAEILEDRLYKSDSEGEDEDRIVEESASEGDEPEPEPIPEPAVVYAYQLVTDLTHDDDDDGELRENRELVRVVARRSNS
jgi:hypothetical protein